METFVAEVHRVLRPGGHFVVGGPARRDRRRRHAGAAHVERPRAGAFEQDITADVLHAMRLDDARKAALVQEWIPRPFRARLPSARRARRHPQPRGHGRRDRAVPQRDARACDLRSVCPRRGAAAGRCTAPRSGRRNHPEVTSTAPGPTIAPIDPGSPYRSYLACSVRHPSSPACETPSAGRKSTSFSREPIRTRPDPDSRARRSTTRSRGRARSGCRRRRPWRREPDRDERPQAPVRTPGGDLELVRRGDLADLVGGPVTHATVPP